MKKEIFREYDIRGIYPEEINEQDYETIGKAFASYINDKRVIIGHDNRLSSVSLSESLVKGLTSCGAHVIDIGLCTTPMYYAIKKRLGYHNGIMITASHNPKEYNGIKLSFSIIGNAFGKTIEQFRDFVFENRFNYLPGSYEQYTDVEDYYLSLFTNGINLGDKQMKVAFDPGNGTSGIILRKILDQFNITYTILNEESNGEFPNHHPDPAVPANMEELGKFVKKNNYDLGIGIDGDGDRCGFVDNEGEFLPIDKVMIFMYRFLYPNLRKKKAVMDVKCSKAVIDECNKLELPIEVCRTGASIANYKINKDGLDYGAEFSGHMWFADRFPCFDDGIYAGLRVVEMLSKLHRPLTEMCNSIPVYYSTEEIKYPIDDTLKTKLVNIIKEYLNNEGIKYNDVDGIRIDYDDGFALIRQSNTTPNLTLRFEKKTQADLEKLQKEYLDLIDKLKKEL